MRTSREACSGWGRTVVLGSHTSRIDTRASTCTDIPTPRACPAQRFRRRGRPPPAPPESSGSYRTSGGGLQGCPLRGVRPRRWRCGCRARTALRSRRRGSTRGVATRLAVGPPARAHRPDEPDASPRRRSCRPSFAVAFEHRLAHRAQGKACVPLQPVQPTAWS